jgi:BirA family biotin operon repressor/biotin-[acetyl-CoA-carboxylase] ligase
MSDYQGLPSLLAERGISLGTPLAMLGETTSTNDEAKSAARSGAPHGATFIAESQTAGRGRQGRAWLSARGENVLLSVVVRLPCPPERLPLLSLVAGLAACEAIARSVTNGAEVRLKWPNDVLIGERKVCGVLVEAQQKALVVGAGINVHTRAFPEAIADRATSVALHSSVPPDRARIVADFLQELDRDLPLVAARGLGLVHGRIAQRDALRGRSIETDQGLSGIAEGIDLEGRLSVRKIDGSLERLLAGEVHLLPYVAT